MSSGEEDFLIDLEIGGGGGGGGDPTTSPATSEEEGNGDSNSSCRAGRKTLSRACIGDLCENDTDSTDDVSNLNNGGCGRVEVVIENCTGAGGEETKEDVVVVVPLIEKRNSGESRKKPGMKKSSKPPRPPRGPLSSASDLKLVKELSELAARKRARIERVKALRKMKENKRSASASTSSSSNVTAMVMTALFFIVIIFQGTFCGNSARKQVVESPAPATTHEALLPFKLFNNAPSNDMNLLSSLSYRSSMHPSSSSPLEQGRDAR